MAIAFGFNNIMIFLTSLSPIIFASFFIIMSFFNSDLKGFVWLIGAIISMLIGSGLRYSFKGIKRAQHPWIKEGRAAKPSELPTHDFCDVFEPMFESSRLSTAIDSHALFHGFTLTYLILGNNDNPYSPGTPFIAFYSVITILDLMYRMISRCITDSMFGLVGGILFGVGLGFGWYALLAGLVKNGSDLMFFSTDSESRKCKLSKRTFKCNMINAQGKITKPQPI